VWQATSLTHVLVLHTFRRIKVEALEQGWSDISCSQYVSCKCKRQILLAVDLHLGCRCK